VPCRRAATFNLQTGEGKALITLKDMDDSAWKWSG
jgi:hypothetical protein